MINRKKKYRILIAALSVLLVTVAAASLCIGRYSIIPADVFSWIGGSGGIGGSVFFDIRLPRICFAALGGAALALAGTVFQSLFRNPLVSPDVLGVTSGCSLGAAAVIVFFAEQSWLKQAGSFAAGILAVMLSLAVARSVRGDKTVGFVVSGLITGGLSSALLMLLKYTADPYKQLPAIDFWLMGGFYNVGWADVLILLPVFGAAAAILLLLGWRLKVLAAGEEEARTLGINTRAVRAAAILCSTLLVASVVSIAGAVSWIGIFTPHIVRLLWGDDIHRAMPLSMLAGAAILLAADTAARSIMTSELPISILTSLIGAVFLAFLLTRKKKAL